jgi:ABC-type spermidine/putrescine transport system permease subunit I
VGMAPGASETRGRDPLKAEVEAASPGASTNAMRRGMRRSGRDPSRLPRAISLLALIGIAWTIVAVVVPMYVVVAIAFGRTDPIFGLSIPNWNPIGWRTTEFHYVLRDLFQGGLGRVWIRTTVYVMLATSIAIVIGYPVAYFLARCVRRGRAVYLLLVLTPLWIPYMMRMLAWIGLLGTDGIVNAILRHAGIAPVAWLSGKPIVVIMGLVYGYIPFLVLPLFVVLERVPESTLEAGRDLGASAMDTFRRVTFPQSLPGLLAGIALVSLPMLGDFYTTNLLSGSPSTGMIGNQIDFYINQSRSSGSRGAAITLLLVAFTAVFMVYYLLRSGTAKRHGSAQTIERAPSEGSGSRILRWWTWGYILWMLIPVGLAVAFSFNAGRSRSVWQGGSLQWYLADQSVFKDDALRSALGQTLRLAALTTLITVPLGLGLAMGLTRWSRWKRSVSSLLILVPLAIPEIVLAVGLFFSVSELYRLIPFGTPAQLMGHVIFMLPVVVLIIEARLLLIGPSYEESAMDLGSSPMRAIGRVLVPMLMPALLGAALFTAVGSMDDFVISQFLAGGQSSITVPMRLYVAARSLSTPATNALATLLLLANVIVITLALLGLRWFRRRDTIKGQGQAAFALGGA